MWQLVTDIPKSKQALGLALPLTGKCREVATEVCKAELSSDDGMTILLAKLDQSFQKDSADPAYDFYEAFENDPF